MAEGDHPRQPYMVRGGGHYMAEGDHPWRRRWSGRTIHGSRTWSGGDTIWRKGTIHGAADGPAGPTVGGTIYGMTGA